MANILVTDGSQRAALAIVRSLGRAGHNVAVCAENASLAGASRWCRREHTTPDPLTAPDAFVERVRAIVATIEADLVIPVTEAALLALLPIRDRLAPATVPFVDVGSFSALSDKKSLLAVASRMGIQTPPQRLLEGPDDLRDLDALASEFPIVVKPYRSVVGERDARFKTGVSHVGNESELRTLLERMPPAAYPLLLQRRIIGPGIGVFLLIWDERVVARFGHRRIREKPPSGGVSVLRESCALPEVTYRASVRLLQHFHWQGVAMVEYKRDARTGVDYLMEVNGRFWGSLQLAIDAGVDFPRLLVDLARGRRPDPVLNYPPGVVSRWEWGDVDHLLARLRHSPAALSLPPGAPGRLRTLARFVADFGRSHGEVMRLSDPLPGWRETVAWFRDASQ